MNKKETIYTGNLNINDSNIETLITSSPGRSVGRSAYSKLTDEEPSI